MLQSITKESAEMDVSHSPFIEKSLNESGGLYERCSKINIYIYKKK